LIKYISYPYRALAGLGFGRLVLNNSNAVVYFCEETNPPHSKFMNKILSVWIAEWTNNICYKPADTVTFMSYSNCSVCEAISIK